MTPTRMEGWEGRDAGGLRDLLANTRWKKTLLRFLELSGVGRIVASGKDEEQALARKMDESIIWEDGKEADTGQGVSLLLSWSTLPLSRPGDSYPMLCALCNDEGEEFLMFWY
jgi:hypothetical protein